MKKSGRKWLLLSAALSVFVSGNALAADSRTSYTTDFGNVVGDAYLNVGDMEAVQKNILTIAELSGTSLKNADVDRNGTVNILDMEMIQKDILEIEKIENLNVINQVNASVSVHDPSIIKDEKTGTYYIFGSHLAWAKSTDLVNWTTFENNINKNFATLFKNEAAWAKKADSSYNVDGNMWAPDVIWNDTMQKWCMYMSINGPKWNSTICLLTADRLDGDWTYVGPVIQSGMSMGFGVTFDYTKVTGETAVNSRYTNNVRNGNPTYEPHAIDPCVLYDDNGDLWMSYGSWSGGIGMFKLDKNTGLRDYTTKYTLDSNNLTDPYYGYKIAGGNQVSGEASYIQKIGDYYYLFMSYGGLVANGGYSMRIFRSDEITGPYKDASGDYARYPLNGATGSNGAGNINGNVGIKLMTYYKWDTMDVAQVAQGHNSAFVDEDGKAYVVFHTRTNDGTEGHYVKVHQLFTNEDGWLVASPYQYSGETLKKEGYTADKVAGTYSIMMHKQSINYTGLEYVKPVAVTLNDDGSITGAYTGKWSLTEKTPYITLVMNNKTYKGVVVRQMIEGTEEDTMCLTLLGSDEMEVWGSKYLEGTRGIDMAIENLTVASVALDDVDLPETGMYGTAISWKSDKPGVIADDGTLTAPKEDTVVTLTATFKNNGETKTKDYKVTVYGMTEEDGPIVIAKYFTDSATDISGAKYGTYQFANPFNADNTAGLELYNGAAVEFTVTSKGTSDRLGAILGFKDSDVSGSGGMCWFTAGSYLGYNAAGGYFDANMANWTLQKDFLGSASATPSTHKVRIDFLPNGWKVEIDGKAAYTSDDLKNGTITGNTGTLTSYPQILKWLNTSAKTINFGAGSFWDDLHFNGTIKDVVCYAYPVEKIDTSMYAFYEGFDKSDLSMWASGSASGDLSISNDGDSHKNYFTFTSAVTATGNRGAFGTIDTKLSENYTVETSVKLNSGNVNARSLSQYVLATNGTDGAAGNNNGTTKGYLVKLATPALTSNTTTTTWYLNDTTTSVTIPRDTWVNIKAVVKTGNTVELTITNEATNAVIYSGNVTANGSTELTGIYILRGRGSGTTSVDTIMVTDNKDENAGSGNGGTIGGGGGTIGGGTGDSDTDAGALELTCEYNDETMECMITNAVASGDVVIPEKVTNQGKEYTVTYIGQEAFLGQPVTSVTMPDTIVFIDMRAFMNCSNLKEVKFSSNLQSIAQRAFYFCTGLTEITLPSTLTALDVEAFAECTSLKTIHASGTAASLAGNLKTGSSYTVTN